MKNITKTLLTLASAACLIGSCDVLDIEYGMTLNKSNMWTTSSDLTQSVAGIYSRMRSYFSANECNVFYLNEIRLGDDFWGPSLEAKVQDNFKIACRHNTLSASNTISWSGLYSTIDQANAVLKYADQCNASDEDVAWAKGQAYFARAYCYFWAARTWGYCPINLLPVESTDQEECYPEQRTPAEVYAQVESDILACEEYASSMGSNKYFGTKDALLILKADYALWMNRVMDGGSSYLTMAEEALLELGIGSSRLLSDYASVFDRSNKVNDEIVFALNNTATEKAGYQIYFCQPATAVLSTYQCSNGGPVPIYSTQWWASPQTLVDELKAADAAGDTRIATDLGYGNYSSAADRHEIYWCNKLMGDTSVAPIVLDNDLLYYRYAYAVMMYAELKYYQRDYSAANEALNIIAKRAYGKDNYYTDTNADTVLANLLYEYKVEFLAEGIIWVPYIRTGAIWDIVPNNEIPTQTFTTLRQSNANILLWPIARTSLNRNSKLYQVEGWS